MHIVILFVTFINILVGSAESHFNFDISPPQIEPGQAAVLTITLPKPNGFDYSLLNLNDSLLVDSEKLHVLDRETFEEQDQIRVQYRFTGYQPGPLAVPAVEVVYHDKHYGTFNETIQVVSSRASSDEQLRDPFLEIPPPLPWVRYAFIALTILFSLVGGRWLWKRLAQPSRRLSTQVVDPEAWLAQQLRDYQEFSDLDRFSTLIKTFLEMKSNHPVRSYTSKEVLSKLKQMNEVDFFKNFLGETDALRYSPGVKHWTPLVREWWQKAQNVFMKRRD